MVVLSTNVCTLNSWKFSDRNASTLIGICTHLTLICNRSGYTAPWILTSNITQLYTSLCLSTTANQKCNIWWFLICEYFETQRCLAQFYYSASKNPSVFFQTWYCILVYYGCTLWLYGSLTLSVHNWFFLLNNLDQVNGLYDPYGSLLSSISII